MKSSRISFIGLVVYIFVLGVLAEAFAAPGGIAPGIREQEQLTGVVTPQEEEEFVNEVDTYARYMPSRKVDAQAGKVAIVETNAGYAYNLKAFGKLPIELSVQSEYVGINNSTVVKLPAHLTAVSTGIEVTLPFFTLEKTYIRFGVSPSYYTDNWSAESSAFRIPILTYLIYQPNEKLTFVLGVSERPDFYNEEVSPIVGVIYKPNDKLAFNLVPPRPNITYMLNNKLGVFVEGALAYDEYEVTQNGQKGLILMYEKKRLGTGLKYKVNRFIQAWVTVGGVFNQTLQYRDSTGKVKMDNGFYSEVRLRARF
ncbi:MAG: DUF6268 family outer membrane beta-barrel protein [Candidatus Omnitrophica bacterium]|nr:DUF6268 family outer membrane beta-barrel protein [Candidatus Omnitrophota bacterium]MDD5236062.1 DUF6268 family outer membrane beta-barrel protein [Candidatus Omnitrophota bacterium]MDD5609936.1 DUF6268 family outer membrane beta-barrel protein [Candidatus Omnitrophota bacterium]